MKIEEEKQQANEEDVSRENGGTKKAVAGVVVTETVDSWFDGAGTAAAAENAPSPG